MRQKLRCSRCGKLKDISAFEVTVRSRKVRSKCRICRQTQHNPQRRNSSIPLRCSYSEKYSIKNAAASRGMSVSYYLLKLHKTNLAKKGK